MATAKEAAHGGVSVSMPALARSRRISAMAFLRVVIEFDLTGGLFSVPSGFNCFCCVCDSCACACASAADSRTRFASSPKSWFMVSRLWRSSRICVARRLSRAVRREMESTFFLLRMLTPWRRKTFLEGAVEGAEVAVMVVFAV